MKTLKYDISGMTCSACVAHVEKSVSTLDGINKVEVNLLTNSMVVEFDENKSTNETIQASVKDAGYNARIRDEGISADLAKPMIEDELSQLKSRWWWSFSFLFPLMYLSMGSMIVLPYLSVFDDKPLTLAFSELSLSLPIAIVNRKFFITGSKTLLKGAPNMDSLIAIGSGAGFVYGIVVLYLMIAALELSDNTHAQHLSHNLYFESSAAILSLITLGKYLEAKSKKRTTTALEKLVHLTPSTALSVNENGEEKEMAVTDIRVGQMILIKPGCTIPVDGVVKKGFSSINEAALTGESMPVEKAEGENLLAGSINLNGSFIMVATKVGQDTTLSQIIKLVENASASKAPIARLADKISGYFVPVVMGIALVTFLTWMVLGYPIHFALTMAISVLVISCPCALGLATPVAIMVASGRAAALGILIKSAESLEIGREIDTVVLDKTGTITTGVPTLRNIETAASYTSDTLLMIAGSLEAYSEHPLSQAIVKAAKEKSLKLAQVDEFTAHPGMGITGNIDGAKYCIGNKRFMESLHLNTNELESKYQQSSQNGHTVVFLANSTRIMGILSITDTLKPSSIAAVAALKEMGIEVIMLTGDNQITAKSIQNQLGIERCIAEVLPHEKNKVIEQLKSESKTVAMVGDGINDAAALASAHLGIAIGSGTDIAIDSADVILMKDNLMDIVGFIQLSKITMTNIKQNLFWAFVYNVMGIPIAAGVFYTSLHWQLNPMIGAAAMSVSSVTVVLNALRIRNVSIKNNPPLNTQIKTNMEEKTLKIEGMSCGHCSARVENALNKIDGVSAKVDLTTKTATIQLSENVPTSTLAKAVEDAGYTVVE